MFLASDEAGFITGQVVGIDGGLSVQSRTFRDAPAYLTPQNLEEKGSS
jgi:enoyl-[acyl-carrier-protein] reductase (NADH)